MVILLILFLWLISISIRLVASSVDTIRKINAKSAKVSGSESSKVIEGAANTVGDLASKFLRLCSMVLDFIRYLLTLLLPVVLIVDIVTAVILVSISSGYLLLLDDYEGMAVTETSNSVERDKEGGKSKVILIGDSRTVQLGVMVLGMSMKDEEGPAGIMPTVIGTTSDGDYLYAQSSIGINWLTDKYNVDRLYDEIAKDPKNTSIVMNLGANDLNMVDTYISYLKDNAKDWVSLGCDVYFMSCNPVNENINHTITNDQIKTFNTKIKDGLPSTVTYLDCYSKFEPHCEDTEYFNGGTDGIHYSKKGYELIWAFVEDNCKSVEEDDDGSLGSKVYNEAKKYVGVLPYVYGGSSLEDGADCSGFICALYKKFGVDIYDHRTAESMQTLGTEVKDLDSAKAGDIICWEHHVALYDGKGGIVHEKDSASVYCCTDNAQSYPALNNYITIRRVSE